MNLPDFINKLRRDREILSNAAESMSNEIAESSLTLIKDRSINEGISIDGVETNKPDYSTRPMNTQKFKGKELNARGSKWIQANALGTWHQFRKVQGLNSEKVNLSYTNEMWEHIQALNTIKTGDGKAQTVIGSYDPETNKKMAANTARFGNFLIPTPDELQTSQEVLQEKIIKLLRL